MKGLMQQSLGPAWHRLPLALQAHYRHGPSVETGHLDIAFPALMRPVLWMVSRLGALLHRTGRAVPTQVEKFMSGPRLQWRRTLRWPDGRVLRFDSAWELQPNGHVIEFVNPWLGLQMQPFVVGRQLHYRGVRFILRFGRRTLGIPEWMALGHTTIAEEAIDDRHFTMDFRMTHPVLGQVFRYSGCFEVNACESPGAECDAGSPTSTTACPPTATAWPP